VTKTEEIATQIKTRLAEKWARLEDEVLDAQIRICDTGDRATVNGVTFSCQRGIWVVGGYVAREADLPAIVSGRAVGGVAGTKLVVTALRDAPDFAAKQNEARFYSLAHDLAVVTDKLVAAQQTRELRAEVAQICDALGIRRN